MTYCNSSFRTERFKTRSILFGDHAIGERNPIAIADLSEWTYDLDLITQDFIEQSKRDNRPFLIKATHSPSDGSLADTVKSLIEAGMLCHKMNYHQFMFSIEASKPFLMIEGYRRLVAEMKKLKWNYPIHLGFIEEKEKIESIIGIGALLLDGIGDAISGSFAKKSIEKLRDFAQAKENVGILPFDEHFRDFTCLSKREVLLPKECQSDLIVLATLSEGDLQRPDIFRMIGCENHLGCNKTNESTLNYVVVLDLPKERTSFEVLNRLQNTGIGIISPHPISGSIQLATLSQAKIMKKGRRKQSLVVLMGQENPLEWEELIKIDPSLIIFRPIQDPLHEGRAFFEWIMKRNIKAPVILNLKHPMGYERAIIQASAEYGALLADGLGEGIWMDAPLGLETRREISFDILNALRPVHEMQLI